MGCDIHCTVEHWNGEEWVKVEGRWGYYHGFVEEDGSRVARSIYTGRNYSLFGFLASVRSGGYDDRSEPRGYPNDCNAASAKDVDDGDLHSHSYMTLTELLNWDLWWTKHGREEGKWFYEDVIGELMLIDEDWDNVRLLFCFDN